MKLVIKEMKSFVKQQVCNVQAMLFILYVFQYLKMYQLGHILIDYIITQGNNLMKCSGNHKPLAVDEVPLSVKLKGGD